MLITFGLLFLLGLTISQLERNGVMRNWDKRRCEFPVMTAGMFFKPNDDPRSSAQFASDNFTFCMKQYVDNFIELAFAPFQTAFSKQTGVASDAMNMISTMRNIANSMYNAFIGFMQPYMRRFTSSVYEMGRIVQYLRLAIRRANAVMLSMLYQSLTVFRGMINFIQLVMKVILIICGIMLAIIIILIFVLFPFIPLILSVLGAIIATILAMVMVMAGSVDQAVNMKQGFCFAKSTKILVRQSDGKEKFIPISSVKIGDVLGCNCGEVTAVIQMEGKDVTLYNLNGILVSGSHVVQTEDGHWNLVENDKRAVKSQNKSSILYCFNTSSHNIPVYSPEMTSAKPSKRVTLFRDWEEIPDEDEKGQYGWNYIILKTLNKYSNYNKWKDGMKPSNTIPVVSENTLVKTIRGYIQIKEINETHLSSNILCTRNSQPQTLLGVIDSIVTDVELNDEDMDPNNTKEWHTELYEWNSEESVWVKGTTHLKDGKDSVKGKTFITSSGEFIIWDSVAKKDKIVRDFTDIGYTSIHQTYPYVAERLRLVK